MVGFFSLRLYRQSLAVSGILALAWWIMAAAPSNSAPQFTVNQFRKGDRLPMTRRPAAWHGLLTPQSLQSEKKLPLGCDPAFGPNASPGAKSVYGRCVV
jgi:hypothetical protein